MTEPSEKRGSVTSYPRILQRTNKWIPRHNQDPQTQPLLTPQQQRAVQTLNRMNPGLPPGPASTGNKESINKK